MEQSPREMVTQLGKKFTTFLETKGSLLWSQEPATGHYPEHYYLNTCNTLGHRIFN
jgi:hypothetical protein